LRVLFPFVGDSVGGSHHSILELYSLLKKSNITPIFLLHNTGPLSQLLDSLNIKYEYVPVKYLAGESPSFLKITFGIIFNFFKLHNFIHKNKIDIVHGNDLRINLTWSLPTRLSGVVYLWHQRSIMSSSVLWRISTVLADYFVTISKYVHQSLPDNIPESRKKLVLNPFDTNKYYDEKKSRKWINTLYGVPEDTVLFGYIGRLVDWKNVDFLIKCFAKYTKKSNLNLHLIIVGTGKKGYVDSLEKLVNNLEIKDIVTFAGFNSDPSKVISAFDLMIAPSNQEPFGRTLVEAMIQKTFVLAARGGGHSEIIDNEVTGRLYDHNDISSFISKCNMCINDNESKYRIINKANTVAILKYSSHEHAKSIVNIYHKLLSS